MVFGFSLVTVSVNPDSSGCLERAPKNNKGAVKGALENGVGRAADQ
jgi:hypothetical protein